MIFFFVMYLVNFSLSGPFMSVENIIRTIVRIIVIATIIKITITWKMISDIF